MNDGAENARSGATVVELQTQPRDDIAVARQVLDTEAAGLSALAAALDNSFVEALDILEHVEGRVIVTGMGKSGHVARKIAATLASTGTPAQFVHPAEASHGDLGMITDRDAILALSNSGSTRELADLLAYATRFAIPLISMTGRADSALGRSATVNLVMPDVSEACTLELAPTTSTTMTMAFGDALAVALLDRKGFRPEDFQLRHPGGHLGKRLVAVGDIMHHGPAMPLVAGETPMSDALIEMSGKSFGCVGVTDADGRLAGIITDGDLRRKMSENLLVQRADEVMTGAPQTVASTTLAAAALGVMNEKSITSLFVVDDEVPRGIVHIHDCLRAGIV